MSNLIISNEVLENRYLVKSDPIRYKSAPTYLLPCEVCGNKFMEIFAKDKDFTSYTCGGCK